MDVIHEDDGLWDELSHQQSREIEQHRARTLQDGIHHDGQLIRPVNQNGNVEAVQRVARRAADDIQRFTRNVYQSTMDAYQETVWRQKRNRHAYHNVSNPINRQGGYLDDFGISTRDDPLLTSEAFSSIEGGEQTGATSRVGRGVNRERDSHANYVVLPRLSRRPVADGWRAESNLDLYFSSLYTYYYHRGLVPIVGKGFVELVTLFLTLNLSIFLFAHVNWRKLATCVDETTCESDFFPAYYVKQHLSPGESWTWLNAIVRVYFYLFLAFGVFSVWAYWQNVQNALKSKRVFEDWLGIPAHKLEGGAVDWDRDVVQKLCELQESGEYRVAIHGQQRLDAVSVAHRILRKENFFVALFNQGLLDLSVPFAGHDLFCASLEWSLYFCIFNFMFNHKYNIRPAFYLDHSALKRRFILCGIAHALFMPFLLVFMTLHFCLSNAYDWKSMQQYLGPREWSLTAKWTFREFNELPHFFERRLAPSYEASEEYLKLFGQNEITTAAGRILVFLGGSIGAVLFVFAAINDAILLHVKIADWNLLWYAGVAGIIYSTGKSLLPKGNGAHARYVRNVYAARDTALANVANHTHHCPDIWRGRGWDLNTHKSFASLFKFKAQLFLQEMLSVVVSPYILCFSLPRDAERICEFVLAVKSEAPGVGEVCGFATFNFDIYGDESWEGKTIGKDAKASEIQTGTFSSSVLSIGFEEASKRFPKPKAKHGKMEKSFFSFKASHPSWEVSESGQHLVERVEQYQREETAALTREQQLHIEAAARQLETLARLEQQRSLQDQATLPMAQPSSGMPQPLTNESLNSRGQAPADAGAGMFRNSAPECVSAADVVVPPPPAAFAPFSIPKSISDQDTRNNEPDEAAAVPFALSMVQSSLHGSPTTGIQSTEMPPLRGSIPATGTSLALSTDMLRLLNMSSLETGSLLDDNANSQQNEGRQYMWLDRYHAHIAAQQEQEQANNHRRRPDDDAPSVSQNIV